MLGASYHRVLSYHKLLDSFLWSHRGREARYAGPGLMLDWDSLLHALGEFQLLLSKRKGETQ